MSRSTAAVAAVLVASACAGASDSIDAPPSAPPTADTALPAATTTDLPASTAVIETTTTTVPAQPLTVDELVVTGSEEVVFDWTTDRCEDEHIPDIAARAYRDANGLLQLTIGHYVTYRMTGSDFDSLTSDCTRPQLDSDYDSDPAQFNDSEWLAAPYTLDGTTVYAVVHNEYRGDTHPAERPGQCTTRERLRCLDTSFTMAVSTDGGATYQDIAPAPDHLIATLPYLYDDDGVPSGIRQPSNIVRGPDDYFYLLGNISDQPDERQRLCVMRTDDLADPSSWRYWDGEEFAGEWINPYREGALTPPEGRDTCAPLADDQLSASLGESIVYDESIGRFVTVGISFEPNTPDPDFAVYYSTSENLIEWSERTLLLDVPTNNTVADPDNDTVHAYPSLIDHQSDSINFETTDGEFYLYLSRFNFGGNSLDRDLLRWPVRFETVELPMPTWNFDDPDDDVWAWRPTNGLAELVIADGMLSTTSTGDDPSMDIAAVTIDATNDTVRIRMAIDDAPGDVAQLFFSTNTGGDGFTEALSVRFDVIDDGEFHEYALDLSSKLDGASTIDALRFDPVGYSGSTVRIDSIQFQPG